MEKPKVEGEDTICTIDCDWQGDVEHFGGVWVCTRPGGIFMKQRRNLVNREKNRVSPHVNDMLKEK